MNEYDRHNLRIRATGTVFADGQNNTLCSHCGRPGAEFQGEMNDSGEDIALCPDGEGCYEHADDDDPWESS